jgi:hypothetical protein
MSRTISTRRTCDTMTQTLTGLLADLLTTNRDDPANALNAENTPREVQADAQALRLQTQVVRASAASEIGAAFATLVQQGANALFVANDAFLNDRSDQIAALSERHRIPAICEFRESVAAMA